MKQAIQQISLPVATQLERFKEVYSASLQSDNQLLNQMVAHVKESSGKQMRPLLVLLCAQLCGDINESTLHAAASLELLHVASLIHDDVIDESDERRGKPSLFSKYQSKAAVLGGDFFLATALSEAVKTQNLTMVNGIANMGKALVDGELLQLSGSKNAIYTEENYFNVIKAKTAELFRTCAVLGAHSASCTTEMLQNIERMGEAIGICFQLKDDVFDYQETSHTGKPTGNDIQEGKMTLPLLSVYLQATPAEQAQIKQAFDNKEVAYIRQLVMEKGGMDYTLQKIAYYKEQAIQYLHTFAASPTRDALDQFILLVANRQK